MLANGLVEVVVDAETGTFSVNGTAGFGRLVDGGTDGSNPSPSATYPFAAIHNRS